MTDKKLTDNEIKRRCRGNGASCRRPIHTSPGWAAAQRSWSTTSTKAAPSIMAATLPKKRGT